MDTRLLHLPAHGCTPKAYLANAAVFPVGFPVAATTEVARRDQFVRCSPRWRDEVEAIGDEAETVALTFQFGRVT
ncbi:hypothetical protein [Micromonospora sp. NPDC005174]|uniref:hypothetical protein n=1 Tax=Micromonospora sp. NPDC005174 TaxID=3157018 RepID=UPI0033A14CCA